MVSARPAARGRVVAALATVYVVWGSTYLAIRVMVRTMPPLLAAGVRFAVAGAIFWVVLRVTRGPARVRASRAQLAGAAVVGTLLCFGGNGVVTVAERHVPSGLAALIIGAVPLIVVLLRVAHGDRVPRATVGGVAAGFAGLALLLLPGTRSGGASVGGMLLCLLAASSWATGSFYSARLTLPSDALVSTAWQMLFGGLGMVIVGLAAGEGASMRVGDFSAESLAAFAYLILIGSLLAFTAYVWLLRNVPISTVATYAYVNPVIALALGAVLLGERITWTMIAAATAIVLSVATVVNREGDRARAATTGAESSDSSSGPALPPRHEHPASSAGSRARSA